MNALIRQIIFVFFVSSLLCFSCHVPASKRTQAYGANKNMPSAPGKCYAKCLIPDQVTIDTIATLPIYNGNNPEEIQMEEFIVHQGRTYTKWVKKKADKNCLSADPDDCLVWCLQEMKEDKETINYMLDTSQSDEYEMKVITKTNVSVEGGHTDWKEVVCAKDHNSNLFRKLSSALLARGYIDAESQLKMDLNSFSPELKAALIKFQKDNSFPIGQLDVETLEGLGVN